MARPFKHYTHAEWIEDAACEYGVYWRNADGRNVSIASDGESTYGLRGDTDGSIGVEATAGSAQAVRDGSGEGEALAIRDGGGDGHALAGRYGDGDGDARAFRAGPGTGNALATRGEDGDGHALAGRYGPGEGNAAATRDGDGDGDAMAKRYDNGGGIARAARYGPGEGQGTERDALGARRALPERPDGYSVAFGDGFLRVGCVVQPLAAWRERAEQKEIGHEPPVIAMVRTLLDQLAE